MTEPTAPVAAAESIIGGHAILTAAFELGILGSLAGGTPRTAEDLAREHGLDARATRTVLSALAELDLIREVDGRYAAGADLPGLVRPMTELFGTLSDRLITGRPALAGDLPSEAGRLYEGLAATLGRVFSAVAEEVADRLAAPGLSILDAGAGAAPWTLAIVRKNPGCRVDAVDLPEVVPTTMQAVSEAGMATNYRITALDLLEEDPPARNYDLVVAANLFHLFDEPTAERLLRRVVDAARPAGQVAIVDSLTDQVSPERQRYVAVYAAHLLTRTATGQVHGSTSYRRWLETAGCHGFRRHDCTRFPLSLLIATRDPA